MADETNLILRKIISGIEPLESGYKQLISRVVESGDKGRILIKLSLVYASISDMIRDSYLIDRSNKHIVQSIIENIDYAVGWINNSDIEGTESLVQSGLNACQSSRRMLMLSMSQIRSSSSRSSNYFSSRGYTSSQGRRSMCGACSGTGYYTCVDCSGTGVIVEYSGYGRVKNPCRTCGTTGRKTCHRCGGTGYS